MKKINKLLVRKTIDIELSVVDAEKKFEEEVDELLGKGNDKCKK